MPSQRDVAARAGVSRTAVSVVLNGTQGIRLSEETHRRVWAAAQELGFRPNVAARNLRAQRTDVLGLITNGFATTPYAVAIIKGAQDAAFRCGKMLLIIDADADVTVADDAIAKLAGWRVEGLLVATDHHRQIRPPAEIPGAPVVLVNCFAAEPTTPCVVPDERQGGRLATRTLIEAGHRRIGLINGPAGYPASAGRLAGYRDALRKAGIAFDEHLVRAGDWWQESGLRHANALLDLAEPPTALFCANDWMAMGAYDAVKERGLRIPADVAIIGFDNRVEIAAHLRPSLSTVALPYYDMGRRAVEQLLGVAKPPASGRELIACPLISRASVGGAEDRLTRAAAC